ncbi:COP9 signalosome, subunit CSN4 [Phaffia rhodozyma]|uniref:COP9 signalosome complex subunit 4 n=1 Tax=Phaffia rhodozyma TaxID=264483 RepID=A0A0F7SL75_PHARH|nr:COP9 signalosome, subunit CSN4 [Phaffia rhodozyma]
MSLSTQLIEISDLPQKDRLPAYLEILPDLYSDPSPGLIDLVDHLVNDSSVSLVVGRQVYSEVVHALGNEKVGRPGEDRNEDLVKEVLQGILEKVGGNPGNYEEQTSLLRNQLATILEGEEEWLEAAQVLIAIPLDNSNMKMSDSEKLAHLVHIVRLLIEVGDNGQAQTYLNKASMFIHDCDDQPTRLAYKLCHARLLDFSRKFNEAALRYHELSWVPDLDADDRLQTLSAAVTCSILAPAGPARQRTLASLCRDDRTASLPTYTVLSKMFLENIIRPAEVVEFEKGLQVHQLAKLPAVKMMVDWEEDQDEPMEGVSKRMGPTTVLDRAVLEHNLLSCSKLYVNISFSGLGVLLDLAPAGAELLARKMIEQERLRGWIDQIDELIWFEGRDTDTVAQTTAGGLGDVEKIPLDFQGVSYTERWDTNIEVVTQKVEAIANMIKQRGLLIPTKPSTTSSTTLPSSIPSSSTINPTSTSPPPPVPLSSASSFPISTPSSTESPMEVSQ